MIERDSGSDEMVGRPLRVAVACQGGGSHTAFTAGVLREILARDEVEVVGLSGASGGAVCALLAHYGMLSGGRERARDLLRGFWEENSASGVSEYVTNYLAVQGQRVEASFGTSAAVSPYRLPEAARGELTRLLEGYVDFDAVRDAAGSGDAPRLFVGAADVLSGEQRLFDSGRGEVSLEAVLASCAVPSVFRAVRVGEGLYWDGVYSENPPMRRLPDTGCDEIWVVQIDPRELQREPKTPAEIADRRNQLVGNLSLEHEVHSIETINALIAGGNLVGTEHRFIPVRRITFPANLDTSSKLDRDPAFIGRLVDDGELEGRMFVESLTRTGNLGRRKAPAPDGNDRKATNWIETYVTRPMMRFLGRFGIHSPQKQRTSTTSTTSPTSTTSTTSRASTGKEPEDRTAGDKR